MVGSAPADTNKSELQSSALLKISVPWIFRETVP